MASLIKHAYIVKGFCIGKLAPVEIVTIMDALIHQLENNTPIKTNDPELVKREVRKFRKKRFGLKNSHETKKTDKPNITNEAPELDGRGWPQWKKEKLLEMRATIPPTPFKEIAKLLDKNVGQTCMMHHHLMKAKRDEREVGVSTPKVTATFYAR